MKRKCIASILILFSLAAGYCRKYNFVHDKNIVPDSKSVEESDKFELTIYYNDWQVYRDVPLSVYEIRDGSFEKKFGATFYRHVFMHFFSIYFPKKIREAKGTEKSAVFITTLCEIKNADGELVLWYSYEPEGEKYMVLNGKIFERNKMLIGLTESLIKHSNVIIPE